MRCFDEMCGIDQCNTAFAGSDAVRAGLIVQNRIAWTDLMLPVAWITAKAISKLKVR